MKIYALFLLSVLSLSSAYADKGDIGVDRIVEGARLYDKDFNKTKELGTKSVILVKDNKLFGITRLPLVVFFGFLKPVMECEKFAGILNLEAKQEGVDNIVNYYCLWL